jgi:hypothetical protein
MIWLYIYLGNLIINVVIVLIMMYKYDSNFDLSEFKNCILASLITPIFSTFIFIYIFTMMIKSDRKFHNWKMSVNAKFRRSETIKKIIK